MSEIKYDACTQGPVVKIVRNTSGLKPLGRAVIVKPYQVEKQTSSGIILTNQTIQADQLAEQKAVVIEVGPYCWQDEPQPRAKVGDRILFSKWAGYQFVGTADGETYRVVNDNDIFMQITAEEGEDHGN